MNILLDENVPRVIQEALVRDGHQLSHIAQIDPGITDEQVADRARERQMLVITQDMDFGDLIFRRGARRVAVLLLRIGDLAYEEQVRLVCAAIREQGPRLNTSFSVLSTTKLRIRALNM